MFARVRKHMGTSTLAYRVWERIQEQLLLKYVHWGCLFLWCSYEDMVRFGSERAFGERRQEGPCTGVTCGFRSSCLCVCVLSDEACYILHAACSNGALAVFAAAPLSSIYLRRHVRDEQMCPTALHTRNPQLKTRGCHVFRHA